MGNLAILYDKNVTKIFPLGIRNPKGKLEPILIEVTLFQNVYYLPVHSKLWT